MISTKLMNMAGHMAHVAERGEPVTPVFLSTAAAVLLDLAYQVHAMEDSLAPEAALQPTLEATRLPAMLRGPAFYARIWEATRANFQRQAARKGCPDV